MNKKAKFLPSLRAAFLFCLFFTTIGMFAQVKVTGKVTDEKGDALYGVSVRVKGVSSSGVTDANGHYSVTAPSNKSVLVFSYIGYSSKEETIGSRNVINVKLGDNSFDLNEAVVVAYGTARKGDVTGALTTMKPKLEDAATNISVDAMLMGKVPGLVVNASDGMLGAANSVIIRGANSLRGDNQPLYVIDNVPQASTGEFSSSGISGDYQVNSNPLMSLNPNDIEDITVLKDASSTAIYGSRGANGVILITTKKGKTGKLKVDVSANYTLTQVTRLIDLMDLYQYAAYQNSRISDGNYLYYPQDDGSMRYVYSEDLDAYKKNPLLKYTDPLTGEDGKYIDPETGEEVEGNYTNIVYRNWQKAIYHTAFSQSYNVNLSGGIGKKHTYFVSLGFKDLHGTVKETALTQGDVRANFNFNFSEKLTLAVQLNGSLRRNNMMAGGNSRGGATGAISRTALDYAPFERPNDDPTFTDENKTTIFSWINDYVDKNDNRTLRGSFDFGWKILPNLRYDLRAGGAMVAQDRKRWYGLELYQGMNNQGLLSISDMNRSNYSVENVLNYNLEFKDLGHLDVTAGATYEKYKYTNKNTVGIDFAEENMYKREEGIEFSRNVTYYTPTQKDYQLMSFLGRVNFSLLDKYLFTFSLRADGSSKFAKDNRWGYFPSGAVAWRMEQEEFMKNLEWLNQLKLRVSYGATGNQSIDPYSTFAMYGTNASYHYADGNGNRQDSYIVTNLANNSLKWEKTTSWNEGIDFSFFRSRINGTIDVYQKKTSDLLIQRTLPGSAGFSYTYYNQGSLTNKGVELSLTVVPVETDDWNWSVSGNISFNKSKITDLGLDGFDCGYLSTEAGGGYTNGYYGNSIGDHFGVANIFLEGEAPGLFFGYKTQGIVQTDDVTDEGIRYTNAAGETAYYKTFNGTAQKAGDVKFVDMNGDGVVDENDRTIIGDPNPDFTYGFSTSLSWKQFTLSAQFTGVSGRDVLNTNNRYVNTPGRQSSNLTKEAFNNMWTVDNPSNLYPSSQFEIGNYVMDRYVEDGTYLRCSDITLSWKAPQSIVKALSARSLSAYFTVKNAFIITDYSGYDPEVNSFAFDGLRRGIDMSSYPTPRQFILGLSLGF